MTARILIIDDHPLTRAGLATLIGQEPGLEVCAEAGSLGEGLALIQKHAPDLAILDLTLPDGNGLGLIKRLRAHHSPVRILICSMHDESLFARRVLAAGAQGYISKYEATEHVLEAIHRILGGRPYLSEAMTDRLIQGMTSDGEQGQPSPVRELTNRELEVLALIGQGVGTAHIAHRLNLSVKTIETHRAKLKRKLGLSSAGELTRYAAQWVLEGGEGP